MGVLILFYSGTTLECIKLLRILTPASENKYSKMISDIQLAMFSNLMGIVLFLLVVLYHFIAANSN